jgi:hypothetical protein
MALIKISHGETVFSVGRLSCLSIFWRERMEEKTDGEVDEDGGVESALLLGVLVLH